MIEKNKHIIIVAGGTGSRMKHDLPKQFLMLNDQPIIIHTIKKFIACIDPHQIIIVIHSKWKTYLENLLVQYQLLDRLEIVIGGPTRFDSVKNGLEKIKANDNALIGIHDAARPLVSLSTIVNAFNSATEFGSGIPVIAVSESLRMVNDTSNSYLDRDKVRIVQTPQCFQLSILRKGFEQAYDGSFTDDASVIEKLGQPVFLTEGNQENFKITWPSDIQLAEVLIQTID